MNRPRLILWAAQWAFAALVWKDARGADLELPTVVVEGSATETLQYDPIVSPRKERPVQSSGSGSIHRDLQDRVPLPVSDYGQPGTLAQFRGIGRTVDETNVQTLGIPLNLPQGGGFDLSTFPQFFWSSYRYQEGPQQGAYDPRATAGTLSLEPWTSAALREPRAQWRISQLGASRLLQTAGGWSSGKTAVLAGWSGLAQRGLTAATSARLPISSSRWGARAHLLFSDLTSDSPGSASLLTPNAAQSSQRVIPVVEAWFGLQSGSRLKLTGYLDQSKIHYASEWNNPNAGFETRDTARQAGVESAWLSGAWRVGLSVRRVSFETSTQSFVPTENWAHAVVSGAWSLRRDWVIEPSLQTDWGSGRAPLPGAALGVRSELNSMSGIYLRLSYAPRFANLTDRYYFFAPLGGSGGFRGNPELSPEKTTTLLSGFELSSGAWTSRSQVSWQFKQDVQLSLPSPSEAGVNTPINSGNAYAVVLNHDSRWALSRHWDFSYSIALSSSRVERLGSVFPYLPRVIDLVGLEAHDADRSIWSSQLSARIVSDHESSPGVKNGGYALVNLGASHKLGSMTRLELRLENLTDRRAEVVRGFPLPGRVWSVLVSANL